MSLFTSKEKNILSSRDKKAFYTVLEHFESSGFSNKLGCCFKMWTRNDQLMWVSATSVLVRKCQNNILAEKSKKNENDPEVLDLTQVQSSAGVSFIKCASDDDENYLKFGYWKRSHPDEASAYVFDDQKILELKFSKTCNGGSCYKFNSSSAKPSSSFELRKAVGAPIILEVCPPERNQVVGILDIKSDGSLHPVFFDLNTFDLVNKRLKSPSESANGEQASGSSKTNGDKIDSPVCINGQLHVETSKDDKTDSPVLIEGFSQKLSLDEKNDKKDIQVTNGQQSIQEEEKIGPGKMVGLPKPQTTASIPKPAASATTSLTKPVASAITPILKPVSKCIKNQTLTDSPKTHKLLQKLKIRLDPKKPLGNDYRELADKFVWSNAEITYLGTAESPTIALLLQEDCTFSVLRKKLVEMERDDAVGDIDKYIDEQGCDCENCGGLC